MRFERHQGITEQDNCRNGFEGVSNYCHSEYDWSMAKDNPDIMGVEMGEETDSTFQVVFRSYTGALVNFYVNKESGTTRMEQTDYKNPNWPDFLTKTPNQHVEIISV